jgi:hypothetical protein
MRTIGRSNALSNAGHFSRSRFDLASSPACCGENKRCRKYAKRSPIASIESNLCTSGRLVVSVGDKMSVQAFERQTVSIRYLTPTR